MLRATQKQAQLKRNCLQILQFYMRYNISKNLKPFAIFGVVWILPFQLPPVRMVIKT